MLDNLDRVRAIDPTTIWWEIAAAEVEEANSLASLYSNATGVRQGMLNSLCWRKFAAWLAAAEIDCHLSAVGELAVGWEMVSGTPVDVGRNRLVLLPTENLDRDELRIPREWVDLPDLQGDYFLAVQVDLDRRWMNIWGFISHRSVKAKGIYQPHDRSYLVDSDLLIADLDVLWMARELGLEERMPIPSLPSLDLDVAVDLIKKLSVPSPYSPRYTLDWQQWGAIFGNPSLRQQLYRQRLQMAAIAKAPMPSFRLGDWLRRGVESFSAGDWQDVRVLSVQSPSSNNTIERAKSIDLQVDLQRETVVLLVGIVPQSDDRLRISIRVHPVAGSPYLPPRLHLSYVDENGAILQTVKSRSHDNFIQLPAFTCPIAEVFSVQLELDRAKTIERFML